MNKTFLIVAALLAAPLALASDNPAPKNYCESTAEWATHYYVSGGGLALLAVDGNVSGDCNGDTVPGDYDGHLEWGLGGVILTVAAEDPAFPGCAIEAPHHTSSVHVEDRVFGFGVGFYVGAEIGSCTGVDTHSTPLCIGWCTPTFPPGADGAYHVFIEGGTKGHVTTA